MLLSIWFGLWGLLWAVYFMLDGFDLGLGTLSPFIAKTPKERDIIYKTIGPFWDGNEVWLIAAGGVTFAAFPTAYAVLFSSFYTPLMIILFALIIRGISVEFRGKASDPAWQKLWDAGVFLGSIIPAILFGVAFANIFKGVPIDGDGIFRGSLVDLLNPYGLLGGILFLFLFMLHGALWFAVKTEGELRQRGFQYARTLWFPTVLVAVGFLIATWFNTSLYANYLDKPLLYAVPSVLIPLAVLGGVAGVFYFTRKEHPWYAWASSALTIVGVTFFGIVGLYPNLLPSSLDAAYSLTIYNAASSPLTLKIMLTVVVIFIPLVIAYQLWVYKLFSHPVTEEEAGY